MKKMFSKMDKPLLITMLIFSIFGLIMILSASSMESYMRYDYSPYHYFFRELIFIIIGIIIFIKNNKNQIYIDDKININTRRKLCTKK